MNHSPNTCPSCSGLGLNLVARYFAGYKRVIKLRDKRYYVEIRTGKLSDVAGITEIFNFYINHTNARFDEHPFTVENRQ